MLIFISSFFVDTQEFKFTASCGKTQLTSTDNKYLLLMETQLLSIVGVEGLGLGLLTSMCLIQLTSAPGFKFYSFNSITACGRPFCSSENVSLRFIFLLVVKDIMKYVVK